MIGKTLSKLREDHGNRVWKSPKSPYLEDPDIVKEENGKKLLAKFVMDEDVVLGVVYNIETN